MHASEQSYRRSVDNTKERPEEDEIQQRAVVNEDCPQCNHPQLYYTRPMKGKQCFMSVQIATINLHRLLELAMSYFYDRGSSYCR